MHAATFSWCISSAGCRNTEHPDIPTQPLQGLAKTAPLAEKLASLRPRDKFWCFNFVYLIQGASLEKCQSLVSIKEVPFKDNAEQCLTDACSYSLDKLLIHTVLPCPKSFFYLLPVGGYCYRDIALPISAKLFSHFSDKWSIMTETFQKSNLTQTNTGCCLDAAPASGKNPVCHGSCGSCLFLSSAVSLKGGAQAAGDRCSDSKDYCSCPWEAELMF